MLLAPFGHVLEPLQVVAAPELGPVDRFKSFMQGIGSVCGQHVPLCKGVGIAHAASNVDMLDSKAMRMQHNTF